MRPVSTPPPPRRVPAFERGAGRETLLALVADLVRRPWLEIDARHYLDDYEASQWLPPAPLRELQLAKLRRLVWHCFLDVPYWRARLRGVLQPSAIETLSSLEAIPPAPAGERRRDPDAFAADTGIAAADERVTAGTRGAAQRVRLDAGVAERRAAIRLRAERWAGAPPGQIVAAWGREAARAPRPFDAAEVAALQTAILRARPAVVTGPAAALGELAGGLAGARRGLFGRAPRVSAVIARGPDGDGAAARLAEATGARLVRWYVAAEVGLIAATCDRAPGRALHVQADHVLVEILDDAGRALPPGAAGRVHVTDLHNHASPLLRHDLEDRGRLVEAPCACGRALPLLELL